MTVFALLSQNLTLNIVGRYSLFMASDTASSATCWRGLSTCFGGAALYLLSRSTGRDAATLGSVRRVSRLRELASILAQGDGEEPVVVGVHGRVGSNSPLTGPRSNMRCVVLEETAEQYFMRQSDSGAWVQESLVTLQSSREAPWHLEDATGKVSIVGARSGAGLELSVASQVFEPNGRSLVRGTLDYLQGFKVLGTKRVERVLPVGAALTAVGEAVADGKGGISIQRPAKGPFFVTHRSLDQLIAALGAWSRLYRWLSVGCTAYGVYLLVGHAIRHLLRRRRPRGRIAGPGAPRAFAPPPPREGTGADNSSTALLKGADSSSTANSDLCIICLEKRYDAAFVPCGHMCCCTDCARKVSLCPLCRHQIERVLRTYRN